MLSLQGIVLFDSENMYLDPVGEGEVQALAYGEGLAHVFVDGLE